jgi:hypothetical protein
MIREYLAPADDDDLQAIAPPGTSIGRNFLLGTVPGTAIVAGIVYIVSRSLIATGVLGGAVLAASVVSNVRYFRDVGRRRTGKADERAVEVIEVEASSALDIEPLGSHGPAYVFFSSEGKALLLIGQWLLEQPSFPSLSFRVRRWADTGKPIRIEARGSEIEPKEAAVLVPSSPRVGDIELLDAREETLQQDLDAAFPEATTGATPGAAPQSDRHASRAGRERSKPTRKQ